MVSLGVVLLLTGILMPVVSSAREDVRRVICSSNQRQIGIAMMLYADDNNDRLPATSFLEDKQGEMMAAHYGPSEDPDAMPFELWEGIGRLVKNNEYLTSGVCYCPSHHGVHSHERYELEFMHPGDVRIYTNYHYWGDQLNPGTFVTLELGHELIVATDGLRTKQDFNHDSGMNILRGDLSVNWWSDITSAVYRMLPDDASAEMLTNTVTDIRDFIRADEN